MSMKNQIRLLLAILILASAALACASPLGGNDGSGPSPEAVSTAVALTFQALTPADSTVTETLEPAAGLLPHSLYYLGNDNAGLTQVFRIEKDGKTIEQVTSEPVNVTYYSVSPVDGSVAYVANNQLVLVSADGSGRRVLVDGGVEDEINPFVNRISHPVFPPNGETIAYGHQGLNIYTLSFGVSERLVENQVDDMGNGIAFPRELYWPDSYSPDGSRLLVTLGYYEGTSAAFYNPESKSLVRLQGGDGATICCGLTRWSADGTLVHSANPSMGMTSAGLWEVNPLTGIVTTLLASDWDTLTINHAKYPYLAPDGQLYYFLHTSNNPDLSRVPLQLVRSAPDGMSGRTVILDGTFDMMNEALWSPEAKMIVVAYAPNDNVYQGGQAEIVYLDGSPNVPLEVFAQQMKWGP